MAGVTGLAPSVRSGKLRLLAITSATRQASFEGVPTVAESVPGYESGGWFGFVAPAATPREIVALLNKFQPQQALQSFRSVFAEGD